MQINHFSFPRGDKKGLASFTNKYTKNVLHKSISVKNLHPVGMDISNICMRVRNNGVSSYNMLFVVWKSLTPGAPFWAFRFAHWQNGSLTRAGVMNKETWSLIIFYYGLDALKEFFTYMALFSSGKRL